MESQKVDVLVVGGGVIGLSLALELQSSGKQVLLLEQGSVGKGCSFGNAGWVTPCFAMPLPQPGLFFKSIKWLLDPKSPLYIKPVPSFLLFRWLTSFTLSMRQGKMRKSIRVLTELSKYSLTFYEELSKRHPGRLGFEKKGLLMVSDTNEGLKAAIEEMNLMKEQGVPGELLSAEDVARREPCFAAGLKGGVFFPAEAHIEPYPTSLALAEEFQARGGKLIHNAEVFDFKTSAGKVTEVRSTAGYFAPELLVLAAGTWTKELGKKLGLRLPLLGGKGYSMHVESVLNDKGMELKPSQPIMIVERKIAITPRATGFRIAGTLELVDQDFSISPTRLQAILDGAKKYLHFKKDKTPTDIWRGLRPCTPDGVPVIDFSSRYHNLFFSVGHQMLGLQSAPGSARLAADLILKRAPLTDPLPFSSKRFGC